MKEPITPNNTSKRTAREIIRETAETARAETNYLTAYRTKPDPNYRTHRR